MDMLEQLRAGKLAGAKRLAIAQNLTEFPPEIFTLADSLEILDLSRNKLRSLPSNFDQFRHLKILFLSQNEFEELPTVLANCPQLSMIGFKANRIQTVPENALPLQTRWLILTDNQIEQLPRSMGQLQQLQKLMLAGNQLRSLPESMANCQNLELIRLAANRLEALPEWLLQLPHLSWLAYGGNPCCPPNKPTSNFQPDSQLDSQPGSQSNALDAGPTELCEIDWQALELGETLGEGASGVISKAQWSRDSSSIQAKQDVAVKLFKGSVTSDGLPGDEMQACIAAGQHPNLVKVLGQVVNAPHAQAGLVLSLIPEEYKNLGNPPDFDTCTRDTFEAGASLAIAPLLRIATGIASAAAHLHRCGILHGDLYAHNILVNPTGEALFGDFGAASRYQASQGQALEALEVRAFGCLMEDLLGLWDGEEGVGETVTVLKALIHQCFAPKPAERPRFVAIEQILRSQLKQAV